MYREIKFRAWFPSEHYSEPHMAYLDINDEFGGASATWQLRYLQHPETDGPIYMQYTGLKDKNGVEIYEGDILKLNDGERVTVYYADSAAMFCIARRGEDIDTPEEPLWEAVLLPITTSKMPEVIGNIHENPQLLLQGGERE